MFRISSTETKGYCGARTVTHNLNGEKAILIFITAMPMYWCHISALLFGLSINKLIYCINCSLNIICNVVLSITVKLLL